MAPHSLTNLRMGANLRGRYLKEILISYLALIGIRCRRYWLDVLTSWKAGGLAGCSDSEGFFEKLEQGDSVGMRRGVKLGF